MWIMLNYGLVDKCSGKWCIIVGKYLNRSENLKTFKGQFDFV